MALLELVGFSMPRLLVLTGDVGREVAAGLAQLEARVEGVLGAAVEIDVAAFEAVLGDDVDDAGGAQAVLRRQCPGVEGDALGQARIEHLAEAAGAVGQDDAVDAVLDIVVIAADVQLALLVVGHARRLQQHMIEGRMVAFRQLLDGFFVEGVLAAAGGGRQLVARPLEAPGGDGDGLQLLAAQGQLGVAGLAGADLHLDAVEVAGLGGAHRISPRRHAGDGEDAVAIGLRLRDHLARCIGELDLGRAHRLAVAIDDDALDGA